MSNIWACPYCEYVPYSEYSLRTHIKDNHREYGEAGRCQAFYLTPDSRSWNKKFNNMRCRFSAKSDSPFCGNHAKLGLYISEIVWKDT
jgi:hypothetical protein